LASMVSATRSFFPIKRRQEVCMVPSQQRNFTRTGRRYPVRQDLRLACLKYQCLLSTNTYSLEGGRKSEI
jgi:hypothetical protein